MKKALALIIIVSMVCVSIPGAAISINNSENENSTSEENPYPINLPTESPEVNAQVLQSINTQVDKYLNFGEYVSDYTPRRTVKDVSYPWTGTTLAAGDFVEWVITVIYQEHHQEPQYITEPITINPSQFRDRFLEHRWHTIDTFFNVNDGDPDDDILVRLGIIASKVTNYQENLISINSLRTLLNVDASEVSDRYAMLEVRSELKLNYGLIKEKITRNHDRSFAPLGRFTDIINNFIETIQGRFENSRIPLFNGLFSKILNRFSSKNAVVSENPRYEVAASDNDWLAVGLGVCSPLGEKIPIDYEKEFQFGKQNIFKPAIFEHTLSQTRSQEPLSLTFGLKTYYAGQQQPNKEFDFELIFDPAIYVRTQFIPTSGYVYYYFDQDSGSSKTPSVTFTSNGFGVDDVELTLQFDSTHPLASGGNWFSFDINWLGFEYKANKKHTVNVLLSSPSFSTKLQAKGIPTSAKFEFDADLSFQYQQGQLLDVTGTGSLELDMNSNMDSITLFYPELSADEPKVEFVKVSGIPKNQDLSAHADFYVKNASMTTIKGNGYVDLTMSSSLGSIKAFYRKADPTDDDILFIDVPYGIPASQRIGAYAELYMDMDDFSNVNNYVKGELLRTSTGNLQEVSGYLPGADEAIVSITEIPANSLARAKLEWNRLRGYAYANRGSSGNPDPIDVNLDLGTFNIHNHFELRNGHLDLRFHLAEDGYFFFDTARNMIADSLTVTDESTGDQLKISADNVDADNLDVQWDLDLNEDPIQVEDLAFSGALSILENFVLEATYEGEYLNFDMNWKMGEQGEVSFDFTQDEPIEIVVDDLFPDDPTWDVGGGVIIDQDFHFDVKWNWLKGEDPGQGGEPGEFKINEDTNQPNFDWIGLTIEYTPDGYDESQYGVQVGGHNVGIITWMQWWWIDHFPWLKIWWYIHISGDFYLHLKWDGEWYYNVEDD